MKDLKELYVAAGGDVDNEFVTIPEQLKPFDIVLTVFPTGIEFDLDGTSVDLQVLVDDDVRVGKNGLVQHTSYDVSFKLPIEAIKLKE